MNKKIFLFPWETAKDGCISGTIPDHILKELENDPEWQQFMNDCKEHREALIGGIQYDNIIQRAINRYQHNIEKEGI